MRSVVMVTVLFCLASTSVEFVGAQERRISEVGLTLYKDPDFRGRSVTLRDDQPNFQFIDFNDEASSLRAGRGERWEVCEHANYKGRCAVVSDDESNLRDRGWNDNISSARRLRGGGPGNGRGRGRNGGGGNRGSITLFDDRDFRGRSLRVDDEDGRLDGFVGRAQSVRVNGGAWELCERPRFEGRCVVVTDDLNNLGAVGLANRVASVRPARR